MDAYYEVAIKPEQQKYSLFKENQYFLLETLYSINSLPSKNYNKAMLKNWVKFFPIIFCVTMTKTDKFF